MRLFIQVYHEQIEEGIANNRGAPASDAVIGGYDYVNTWGNNPEMTEFTVLRYGDCYYGCYYSPEDVPFSFQNLADNLSNISHNRWEWEENGDCGYTYKMFDKWYYFKAEL